MAHSTAISPTDIFAKGYGTRLLVPFFTRISHFSEITFQVDTSSNSYTEESRVLGLLRSTKCKHLVIEFYCVWDWATHGCDDDLRVLHESVLGCGVPWITYRARETKRNEDSLWMWYLSRWFQASRDPGVRVDYDFVHEGEDFVRFILHQLVV